MKAEFVWDIARVFEHELDPEAAKEALADIDVEESDLRRARRRLLSYDRWPGLTRIRAVLLEVIGERKEAERAYGCRARG